MSRSLDDWVAYIQTLHARSIDLGLERVERVWARCRPAQLPPVITVAGTNGKGSSVSMLESVYRHAGYHTASFTSPHLVRFNERIRIDNQPVGDAELIAAFERVEALREDISLTFFEFNALLALDIFARHAVDVMILEVGMGGRLDAVNIVPNQLALVTAIGLDHTAWLGDDLEQIAREKGGVIKPGARAVLADPQAPRSLVDCAVGQQAEYVLAGNDYCLRLERSQPVFSSSHPRLRLFDGYRLPRAQRHVLDNTMGVIASIAMMNDRLPVSVDQLTMGLARQVLPGRLQLVAGNPDLLLDVSHNQESVLALIEFIEGLGIEGQVHAVFGALGDKDYGHAYTALKAHVDHWYLCSLAGERGQSASQLALRLFGGSFETRVENCSLHGAPEDAFKAAVGVAQKHDLVVIFGSFRVVGAIIPLLKNSCSSSS